MAKIEVDDDVVIEPGNLMLLGFIHLIRDVVWEAGQAIDSKDLTTARSRLAAMEAALDEVVEKGHLAMIERRNERTKAKKTGLVSP